MFDNCLSMLRKRRRLDAEDPNAQPTRDPAGAHAYWDALFNNTTNTPGPAASFSTVHHSPNAHAASTQAGAVHANDDDNLLLLPSLAPIFRSKIFCSQQVWPLSLLEFGREVLPLGHLLHQKGTFLLYVSIGSSYLVKKSADRMQEFMEMSHNN